MSGVVFGGRPGRIVTDPYATEFNDLDIAIFDLYRAQLAKGQNIIRGRTFRNCHLEGPSVMLARSGVTFDETDFGPSGGDIASLVLRPASSTRVVGAIPFEDCAFIGCRFFSVGFTGPEVFLQQVLALETR